MIPVRNRPYTYVEIGKCYYLSSDHMHKRITPLRFIPCSDFKCAAQRIKEPYLYEGAECSGFKFETEEGLIWHDVHGDFTLLEENHE